MDDDDLNDMDILYYTKGDIYEFAGFLAVDFAKRAGATDTMPEWFPQPREVAETVADWMDMKAAE